MHERRVSKLLSSADFSFSYEYSFFTFLWSGLTSDFTSGSCLATGITIGSLLCTDKGLLIFCLTALLLRRSLTYLCNYKEMFFFLSSKTCLED